MAERRPPDAPGRLSDSAAATLEGLRQLLLTGFTGRIEMECAGGGVKFVNVSRRLTPSDFQQHG